MDSSDQAANDPFRITVSQYHSIEGRGRRRHSLRETLATGYVCRGPERDIAVHYNTWKIEGNRTEG